MTNAYAYLRVSGKGQIEGDGFTRQMTAIRRHAKDNNIRIAKVFREEGVSGTRDLENRPALASLLEELNRDGVRLVLIERLDRLARDLMVQETIIADLRKGGFEIFSVEEPDLCIDNPSRVLVRQIFGAIAQYEKDMIVLKLSGARARKRAKEGRCEGRKPYGYFEGEQQVVSRMKIMRTEGLAYDKIAETLNREGRRPRRGQRWHAGVVHRILTAKTHVATSV
jgi:DNA invertase Pin-like site-specific DNA recombinase